MNGQLEELDRLTTAFGNAIRDQSARMESGLRAVSGALDQAANRLAAAVPGASPAAPIPAAARAATAPAAAVAAAAAGTVRVINDRASPIPVVVVGAPAQPGRGFVGVLTDVLGGVGASAGGLLTGLLGGLVQPVLSVVAGAQLIAVVAQLIGLAVQVQRMLDSVERILNVLLSSARELILLFFNELTAAGIIPVSRLIASLLFLIDRGITLVLSHIQPLIAWAERLAEYTVTWAGKFISAVSEYLGGVVTTLSGFLVNLVTHLMDWVVKPALGNLIETVIRPAVAVLVRDAVRALVDAVATLFLGTAFAIGNVINQAMLWGAAAIAHAITSALSLVVPGITPSPAPGALDIGGSVTSGFQAGAVLAKKFAEAALGPGPGQPAASVSGFVPPPPPPTLKLPGFKGPEFELPAAPTTEPLLEKIMKPPEAPAAPEAAAAPLTVNGGVSVQVSAQTVDMENAEATARVIASHVLEELNRLVERDRFRRGLPTAATA